jgi:hypothetical protein
MAPSWLPRRIKRCFNTIRPRTLAAATAAQSRNLRQNPASLYYLPPELVLGICWYLSLPEIAMLMLVCERFWNGRIKPDVFSMTWELMQLQPGSPDLTYARFYVLRMLEYDGLLARGLPAKYCCWGCMKTHEQQAFPSKEFRKNPNLKLHLSGRYTYYKPGRTFRYCSLAKRSIWFGVRGEMTFAELKYRLSIPHVFEDKQYPWMIQVPDLSCSSGITRFNLHQMSFDYVVRLCKVNDFPFITMCKVLNVPLCPHVCLGNQQVIALYERPNEFGACAKCPTKFTIFVQQFIKIGVMRRVGNLLSPTDPTWLAQSYVSRVPHLDYHCRLFSHWYETTYVSHSGRRNKDGGPEEFKHLMPVPPEKIFKGVCSLED